LKCDVTKGKKQLINQEDSYNEHPEYWIVEDCLGYLYL